MQTNWNHEIKYLGLKKKKKKKKKKNLAFMI